jgi:hypothetical protein
MNPHKMVSDIFNIYRVIPRRDDADPKGDPLDPKGMMGDLVA